MLGTDLNPEFLQRAREARYRLWSFRQTDIHQNRQYFTRSGDTYGLVERLRKHVRFASLNLVKDVYPSPLTGTVGLDLILFRNVAIYLKPEVTAAIVDRFYQSLRPGDWLLLGETEVTAANPGKFEVRRFEHATLYQKPINSSFGTWTDAAETIPPALAGVTLSVGAGLSHVPALPEWVPLPRTRTASLNATACVTREISPQQLTWEQIERAVAAGDLDDAERRVNRIPVIKQRALLRLRFVRSLLARAEITRAHSMLEQCLTEEPLLLEAQLLKAGFAEEAGDLTGAEQACRRALYINPKAPIAHFQVRVGTRTERRHSGRGTQFENGIEVDRREGSACAG